MLQEDEVLDEDGITTTDFLRGRVVFSNSAWYDWRLYLKNHHPLLALFCAHKRHPYGKCTRLMVLISALCFSFAMSTLVTLKLGCNQVCGVCSPPDGRMVGAQSAADLSFACTVLSVHMHGVLC